MTREAVISALKPLIDNNSEVELCILYGSAALDNLSERSDIDIEKMEGVILQEVLVKGLTLKNIKYNGRMLPGS